MPNPMKAQVKIGTINELGNSLEDLKEGAEQEVFRLEGYGLAIKDLETGITSVAQALNEEVKTGEIDDATSIIIKRYLTRCMGSADNLKVRNQKAYLVTQGKVLGLKTAMGQAKKMVDSETQKIEGALQGREGPIPQTDVGRPTMSAAEDIQQRREEAHKAKEAKVKAEAKGAKGSNGKPEKASPKKASPKKGFRCGFCKKLGHTARGCPKKNAANA